MIIHNNFPGTQCCEWYLWKIIIIISRPSTDTEKIQNWIIDKENNFIWHFKSNYPLLCQIKGGKLSQHFFLWAICINVTFPVTPVTDELIQCVSNMSTETRNWHVSVLLCHHVSTLPSSIFASFIVWKSSKNRLPVCDLWPFHYLFIQSRQLLQKWRQNSEKLEFSAFLVLNFILTFNSQALKSHGC